MKLENPVSERNREFEVIRAEAGCGGRTKDDEC